MKTTYSFSGCKRAVLLIFVFCLMGLTSHSQVFEITPYNGNKVYQTNNIDPYSIKIVPGTTIGELLSDISITDGGVGRVLDQLAGSEIVDPMVVVEDTMVLMGDWDLYSEIRYFDIQIGPQVVSINPLVKDFDYGFISVIQGSEVIDLVGSFNINSGAGSKTVYTDNTLITLANPSDIITPDMIFVATSPQGVSRNFNIGVNTSGYASFSVNDYMTLCSGLDSVEISNYSEAQLGSTFHWTLNGQFYSSQFTPANQVLPGGYYNISLDIFNKHGAMVGHTDYGFHIYGSSGDFVISTGDQACPNTKVEFRTNDEFISNQWSIDGGQAINNTFSISNVFTSEGTFPVSLIISFSSCPNDTIVKQIQITPTAIPYVEAGSDAGGVICLNDEAEFFPVNSFGDGYTYHWEMSDGTTYDVEKVKHTIDAGWLGWGILEITNSCGGVKSDTIYLSTDNNVKPNQGFNHNVSYSCPNEPIEFNGNSPGEHIWDFGDGVTTTGKKVYHQFAGEGEYFVRLLVTNGCGNSVISSNYIYINKDTMLIPSGVEAKWIWGDRYNIDTVKILPGKQVRFVNGSYPSNVITNYSWDFGDGTIIDSNDKEISHTYSGSIITPTIFNVVLTATNSCGGRYRDTSWVKVDPNLVPQVDIMVIPDSACVSDPIYFVDNSYSNPDAGITYDVDFGDGNSINDITDLPNKDAILAAHSYSLEGSYNIIVTSRNDVDTVYFNKTIVIDNNSLRKPFYHISNSTFPDKGPYDQFYFISSPVSGDTSALFSLSSLYDTVGVYEAGYGTSDGYIEIVSKGTFKRIGTNLQLNETEGTCDNSTAYHNINFSPGFHELSLSWVSDYCTPRVQAMSYGTYKFHEFMDGYNKRAASTCDTVFFKVFGGVPLSWNYGDGQSGPGAVTSKHVYSVAGYYDAFAVMQNNCGRIDTIKIPVEVQNTSIIDFGFSMSNANPTVGELLTFKIESDSTVIINKEFYWNFGDGSTTTGTVVTHTYTEAGRYFVNVEASNGCGSYSNQNYIYVNPPVSNLPIARVDQTGLMVESGQVFTLDASMSLNSSGGSTGLTFEWSASNYFTIENPTSPVVSIRAPVVVQSKSFTIKLVVNESGKISYQFVEVMVFPASDIIANAGPDIELFEGETGILDGSGSSGTFMYIQWESMDGLKINNPMMLVTTFNTPIVHKDQLFRVVLKLNNMPNKTEFREYTDTVMVLVKNINDEMFVSPLGNDVSGDGSYLNPFLTIQKGVDMAPDSTFVVLLDGDYSGSGNVDITISNKSLYIKSLHGTKMVKIDGGFQGINPIFRILNDGIDYKNVRIQGITMQRAQYGIYANGQKLSISVQNNKIDSCNYGTLVNDIYKVELNNNVLHSSPYIGFRIMTVDSLWIYNNTLDDCDTSLSFQNVNIGQVFNNIITNYGNYGIHSDDVTPNISVGYNNIWPSGGGDYYNLSGGDIHSDPLFLWDGSYRLTSSSPCVNSGYPSKYDPDGTTSDIGAFYYDYDDVNIHQISLKKGWNIFSVNVTPEVPSMLNIVDPLIQGNVLQKVQDQEGNAVEYIIDSWVDDIGNISDVQGYKIKVSKDTVLQVNGFKGDLPVIIPLNIGWNLVGFPADKEINSMIFAQPLIDEGSLIKCQSQTGAAIENLDGYGWINSIGNLIPGEGYNTRVAFSTEFILTEDPFLSITKSANQKSVEPNSGVFEKSWVGYGVDHMNIYISKTMVDGFPIAPGDQIGIFDGDICIGYYTFPQDYQLPLGIKATKDDPTTKGIDGYKSGNPIIIKVWSDSRKQFSKDVTITPSDGYDTKYDISGTTVLEIDAKFATTGIDNNSITQSFDIYPNPTNGNAKIRWNLAKETKVKLEVFNLLGVKVAIIADKDYPQGIQELEWNRTTIDGILASAGIYFVRMTINGESTSKRLVLTK